LLDCPNPEKTNIRRMNKPYHNDQAHIAEEFMYMDDHTMQTARFAYFKINSYKLSLINAAFCISREELTGIIKNTLLNYKAPLDILNDLGYFMLEADN
jgi:siderophore synthetase component